MLSFQPRLPYLDSDELQHLSPSPHPPKKNCVYVSDQTKSGKAKLKFYLHKHEYALGEESASKVWITGTGGFQITFLTHLNAEL